MLNAGNNAQCRPLNVNQLQRVKGHLAGTQSTARASLRSSFAPLKAPWTSWSSLKRQTERLIWDYKRSESVPRLDLRDPPPSPEEKVNICSRNETTDSLLTFVRTRVGYRAHFNRYGTGIGIRCSYPTVPFFWYFTLCVITKRFISVKKYVQTLNFNILNKRALPFFISEILVFYFFW